MACEPCNAKKADRTPAEAGMALKTRPTRPTWVPIFNIALRDVKNIPEEWRDYWTIELE